MVSLKAKNAKLVPLDVYRINELKQEFKNFKNSKEDFDEEEEESDNICYYDIKIQNELDEFLEHKLVKSFNNQSKSCLSIPFEVSNTKKSILNKNFNSSFSSLNQFNEVFKGTISTSSTQSSLSSSSHKITNSSSISSLSSASSSQSSLMNNQTETRLASTSDSSSTLKVEYVPRGKIITINVSIMW